MLWLLITRGFAYLFNIYNQFTRSALSINKRVSKHIPRWPGIRGVSSDECLSAFQRESSYYHSTTSISIYSSEGFPIHLARGQAKSYVSLFHELMNTVNVADPVVYNYSRQKVRTVKSLLTQSTLRLSIKIISRTNPI